MQAPATSIAPTCSRRQFLLLALVDGKASADAPRAVRLPRHNRFPDPQLPYVSQLVLLALSHAGMSARVELVDLEMAQRRSLTELARGASPFDLMWTMTDAQREAGEMIPVRFPVDRGLMGWRVPVVLRQDLPLWSSVSTLADLQTHVAGQGHDWPDTLILRANGLRVETSSSDDALYRMLLNRRFDYFPRSVLEVDVELAARHDRLLAAVPDLLIFYPVASYFFVAPQQPELAEALERGLEAALRDGSFQRLHQTYYGALVRRHLDAKTRVITLDNPLLPPQTPVARKELWLRPGEH